MDVLLLSAAVGVPTHRNQKALYVVGEDTHHGRGDRLPQGHSLEKQPTTNARLNTTATRRDTRSCVSTIHKNHQ